jgi:hypothetical protein
MFGVCGVIIAAGASIRFPADLPPDEMIEEPDEESVAI